MQKPIKGQQRALGRRKPQSSNYTLTAPVQALSAGGAPASSTAYTWVCPETGTYRFITKGPGASSNGVDEGGASGAHAEKVRLVRAGESVSIVSGVNGVDTTVTFSDGYVVTAGKASGATPGTASGGDINLNGSAPGTAGTANAGANGLGPYGGAGAPGSGYGSGGAGSPGTKEWPGAPALDRLPGALFGAGGSNYAGGLTYGGAGGVMIKRVA